MATLKARLRLATRNISALALMLAPLVVPLNACQACGTKVTLELVTTVAANAVAVWQGLRELSAAGSAEIDTGFSEVRTEVSMKSASPPIASMERRLERMRENNAKLESQLKASREATEKYLNLLEKLERDNQTAQLKRQMATDIETQRTRLDERLNVASAAIDQLKLATQRYADIVGFLLVQEGLARVNQQIGEIDQTIAVAAKLDRETDQAIAEGIAILNRLNPSPANAAIQPATTMQPIQEAVCGTGCTGGAKCPTPAIGKWWCLDETCSCPSGLACLAVDGMETLAAERQFELRFASARRFQDEPLCTPPLDQYICLRRNGRNWTCFSRAAACGGHVYPNAIALATDDFTKVGLEITVWKSAPDPNQVDDRLRAWSSGDTSLGLLAWEKTARHERGLKGGALCVGTKFPVPAVEGGENWLVNVFLTPPQ